jgi:pimeloyl-ACP methyl ester carboxylesterase
VIIDAAELDAASAYKLLIGSIVPRAIAWVSTPSRDGVADLAPISFFTGVGRRPPVVSLSLQPLSDGVTHKHTFINIRDIGEFVTNLVTLTQADQMHHTAHEERAIVFVHGFLDDQRVWDCVVAGLESPGFDRVQVDLPGCGERVAASGPFTYERYAADVGAVVDALDKPFVIVGQSMGAAIAELVAAARPERALGLVLLAPVPLAGTRLPDEVIEPFRALGGDRQAQRSVRERLSVGLSEVGLERLVKSGLPMRSEVVRAMANCWNAGVADAPERSAYAGPVLVVRGADDGLVTEDLVSASVSSRFASVTTVTVPRSGHWPHVEQPAEVAAQLDDFVANAIVPRSQVWRQAFASGTAEEFAEAFADDVVLEASVLHRPIEGRDRVKHVMAVASGIYDSLVFTHEANSGALTYVEWEATAFGGLRMNGVTILTRNESGQIVSARIHHRPLGAVLRFSAEMRERLRGAIDPSHFYGGPDAAR